MTRTTGAVKCSCGSTRFVYYHTITEAADVTRFDENGAAVIEDEKWEVVDSVGDPEIRCENGHELRMAPARSPEDEPDPTQWNGDVG